MIDRLEILIDRAQLAVGDVSEELSATRQSPAAFGDIVKGNAHLTALSYARETLSRIWRACPEPTHSPAPDGRKDPSTVELFLANRDRVALYFRERPAPEVDSLEAEIEQETARAVYNRKMVEDAGRAVYSRKMVEDAAREDSPTRQDVNRQRMTVEEANRKAMDLARKLKGAFFALSERQQASRIGCHMRTWKKTPFYQKAKGKRAKSNSPGSRRAVTFTETLEAAAGVGSRDEVLNQLIAEQEAENEPSPLEDDTPGGRPKKVHTHKRL